MHTHTKYPRYSSYINSTAQVSDVWHFTCKLNRNSMLTSHPLTWRWGHITDDLKIQCVKRKIQLSIKWKNHFLVVTVPVHRHCWLVTKLISIGLYISLLQTHKLQRISWLNMTGEFPVQDSFMTHSVLTYLLLLCLSFSLCFFKPQLLTFVALLTSLCLRRSVWCHVVVTNTTCHSCILCKS